MAPKKREMKKGAGVAKKGKASSTEAAKPKAAPAKKPAAQRFANLPSKGTRRSNRIKAKKGETEEEAEADEGEQDPKQGDQDGATPPADAPVEEEGDAANEVPPQAEGELGDAERPALPRIEDYGEDNRSGRAPKRGRETALGSEDEEEDGAGQLPPAAPAKKKIKLQGPRDQSDTGSDNDAGEADDTDEVNWPRVEVIHEVKTRLGLEYEGKDATLNVKFQIHKDPNKFRSRLGYRAKLSLFQRGRYENVPVGYIYSWRIDKPTAARPKANKSAWIKELLTKDDDKADEIAETSLCMRALYTGKGTLTMKAKSKQSRPADLKDNSLIFIEMIIILAEFQKKGLLRHALERYHSVIEALPEWYVVATFVLVPARPDGDRGEAWGDMRDVEVEETLVGVYSRHNYQVWVKDANVDKQAITVMGRTV